MKSDTARLVVFIFIGVIGMASAAAMLYTDSVRSDSYDLGYAAALDDSRASTPLPAAKDWLASLTTDTDGRVNVWLYHSDTQWYYHDGKSWISCHDGTPPASLGSDATPIAEKSACERGGCADGACDPTVSQGAQLAGSLRKITPPRVAAQRTEALILAGDDLKRLHERVDEILGRITSVAEDVAEIKGEHGVCRAQIVRLDTAVFGNGKPGLVERMQGAESGKTDTLSVKSIAFLMGAIGTLSAAVATAVASIMKAQ